MMRWSAPSAWTLLAGSIVAAAFANAAAYIAYAGNPLVASDAWYFIDVFLRQAVESGADFQDYFVKRNGFDHAQPLGKLILLLNARWFGLDFVVEAMIGLAFAAAMFAVFVVAARAPRDAREHASLRMLGLGALAACLVTLNCGMVFDWSLVTLTYAPYLFAALGGAAGWRAIEGRGPVGLAAAALASAFAFDDVGLIINAALAATCALAGCRTGRVRQGMRLAVLVILCEATYVVFAHAFLPQPAVADGSGLAAHASALWMHAGQIPEILRIVFGSTLAHIHPLTHYFGGDAAKVQWLLATLALCAHAWFWWRAFRGGWNAMVFLGVAVMLLFYAFVAGIVYSRVPEYGINYLHEPRYAVFYLLSNVALVCMLMGQPLRLANGGASVAAHAVLLALIVLQVPLSHYTWRQARYLSAYYHSMAWQMLTLGAGRVPPGCVPLLTVCDMPAEERQKTILFLERNRLNVFSPAFVARYRLQALERSASRLREARPVGDSGKGGAEPLP